jgi:glucose-1-phosphate thymidylyltransferase
MGLNFSYTIQEREGGIAEALSLAKDFCGEDDLVVILGDNIFGGNLKKEASSFKGGARIFLKEVKNPQEFGVAELKGNKVINIEEKPKNPKTNYAVTGLYVYDCEVFDIIKNIKPSKRGELEITDVNNHYIKDNKMDAKFVRNFWVDAGTSFEHMYNAAKFIRSKNNLFSYH